MGEYGSGQRSPHHYQHHQFVPSRAPTQECDLSAVRVQLKLRVFQLITFKLDGSWAAEHERRPFREPGHDISLGPYIMHTCMAIPLLA